MQRLNIVNKALKVKNELKINDYFFIKTSNLQKPKSHNESYGIGSHFYSDFKSKLSHIPESSGIQISLAFCQPRSQRVLGIGAGSKIGAGCLNPLRSAVPRLFHPVHLVRNLIFMIGPLIGVFSQKNHEVGLHQLFRKETIHETIENTL